MKLKYGATVHDVVRRGENAFSVDGAAVEIRTKPLGGSRFEGTSSGRAVSVTVARDGDRVFAQVGGRAYSLTIVNRAAASGTQDASASGGLEAPMPGRVTRVAVSVGESVKRGQELMVVEAMKMENALVAPQDGVVKSISVKVGDMVAPGPPLIVIEAAP